MATRSDYPEFAAELVEAVGGPQNIEHVTHCMTRLRFVLKDESVVDDDVVKKIKGAMGVVHNGGQYQIPIGTYVNELFPEVERLCSAKPQAVDTKAVAEGMRVVSKDSLFNRFFKTIAGCILPALGPMAAGGILKGLLAILTTAGVLANTDGTYLILYAAADAIMYFMPIIFGFSAGSVFGLDPYVGACIGGAMIPIIINNLTTLGYCPINAILGLTVWALAGVSLGYAQRIKNPEAKANGFGTMASALCGVTEPTIYTVALTNMKRFGAAFVGGGIAGIIGGLLGLKLYTWAGDGVFRIPGMINPAGLDISFYGFIACAAIAFVVSAIGSYLVTNPNEDEDL